jgi:4-amino-4-deoxy-L-arabinose transferase-like glycosyltransferase
MVRPRFAYWALGVGFALLVFHAARSGCDHDEIVYLHASWLVSQGQRPFVDFMEHHHPTLLYLLAPLARLLEGFPRGLVFVARFLNLALLGLLLVVFAQVVKPVLRNRHAAWPPLVLLGCFFFLRNSMEVRPDPWMNVLAFTGLWQWLVYLRSEGRLRPAMLAGLCFGAAIVLLPKAFFFLGLVGLGTALALRGHEAWARAGRGAAVAVGVALLPVATFGLVLLRLGLWDDFVFWNYTFTPFYYLHTHFDGPSARETFLVSLGEDPLLWLGGLWGVLTAARAAWRREVEPEVAIAAVVVVGFIAAMFHTRWPFSHNLLLMQPLLALLAAVVLDRLGAARLRAVAGVLLLALVAKVCVLCLVYDEGRGAEVVQRRLLAETEPSMRLAVAPPYNPIFRPNAFFFWFNPEYFATAYLDWCRLHGLPPRKVDEDRRAWTEHPPSFVYVPRDEPSWAPFEFGQHRSAYLETDVPGLWELATEASRRKGPPPEEGSR